MLPQIEYLGMVMSVLAEVVSDLNLGTHAKPENFTSNKNCVIHDTMICDMFAKDIFIL